MINLDEFERELAAESLPIQRMFREVVPYFSAELLERILDRTPVDTGLLKASWRLTFSYLGGEIINALPYAEFVHGKQGPYLSDLVVLSVSEVERITVEVIP